MGGWVQCWYILSKILADFAVFDWWRYRKALCDVTFHQIEGNGRKFRHIQKSLAIMPPVKFSNSVPVLRDRFTLYNRVKLTCPEGSGRLPDWTGADQVVPSTDTDTFTLCKTGQSYGFRLLALMTLAFISATVSLLQMFLTTQGAFNQTPSFCYP